MRELISPEAMQAGEKRYFESSGVPSIQMMERAAEALREYALFRFPKAKTIYLACGPGGNGGDGYACARLLAAEGKHCTIFATGPAKSADAIENARRAAACSVEIVEGCLPMSSPDLWIDCLFGTGFSRAPEGFAAELIRRINCDRGTGTGIISADIPSGLDGRTGRAFDPCVRADVTVAFQMAKFGHCLQDGLDVCGEVAVADVGFPADAFPVLSHLVGMDDLSVFLPSRRRNVHKGDCGHLLIVAGSVGMAGAAALCAKSALRSGVGLVTIACPQEIVPILQIHAPCAMCVPLPQRGGAISSEALPALKEALRGKSAVAIGPGLSRRVPSEIVGAVLQSGLPAVIDADALNIISENPALKSLLKPRHVITPHPGEATRLLGRSCDDPVADAQALAELDATVILKGASRVICSGNACFISTSGASGMARGGSGDVLTGLLGGLLASSRANRTGFASLTAAIACEVHGLAGELPQQKYGSRAMNAADILEFLPEVFKRHAD